MGFFSKIGEGLKKTRESLMGTVNSMLHAFTRIDEELFEELEEILITADVSVHTATAVCNDLRAKVKERGITDPAHIRGLLKETVAEMLRGDQELNLNTHPSVILVIGVNGVGKTTTIGKMASRFRKEGK
jgi:fused signal recognition particle receptor